jgi:hypothetical protein
MAGFVAAATADTGSDPQRAKADDLDRTAGLLDAAANRLGKNLRITIFPGAAQEKQNITHRVTPKLFKWRILSSKSIVKAGLSS